MNNGASLCEYDFSVKIRFPVLRNRLRDLLVRLEAADIAVHPASRFNRYATELEVAATSEYDMPSDDVLRIWHRLLIEVDYLDTIMTALAKDPPVPGWKEKIEETLSGGVLRTQDQNDCRARNIQFELLVASIVRQAGYDIQLGEPDVIVTSGGFRFGIAVKRPRSAAKVRRNIRSGENQLKGQELTGLVAVDLTILENASDKHFTTKVFSQTEAALIKRFSETTRYVRAVEAKNIDTSSVFGLITHMAIPVWEPDERTMSFVQRWSVAPLVGEQDPRHQILTKLHENLGYMTAG